jgi:hypothetical protein
MSEIDQELESLREARKELERLLAENDQRAEEADSNTSELVKKIDDPVERAKAAAALEQGQTLMIHAEAINLLTQSVLGLQAAVLVLGEKLGELDEGGS